MKNSLKWILALVAVCLAAIIVVFVSKPAKEEPVLEESAFTEYVAEEFAYAKSFESDDNLVRFYEVQTVLNGNLDTLTYDTVDILASMTVFSVNDTVFMRTRDWESGEVAEEKVLGHWMGTAPLDSLNVEVPFEKAVELLYSTNYPVPAGDKMTFRKPLNGVAENPLYIFGTVGTHFVAVDAVTGEVAVEGLDGESGME